MPLMVTSPTKTCGISLVSRSGSGVSRVGVAVGVVVGVLIRDDMITPEGLIDVAKLRPIARLGYNDYTVINSDTIFTMIRPN